MITLGESMLNCPNKQPEVGYAVHSSYQQFTAPLEYCCLLVDMEYVRDTGSTCILSRTLLEVASGNKSSLNLLSSHG